MTKAYVADVRRRWSEEEKLAIVEESRTSPVARVSKKHGVATSLLFRWRKAQGIRVRAPRTSNATGFVRVALPALSSGVPRPDGPGSIEIVLTCGRRVIVGSGVDTTALRRIVEALEQR